MVKLMSSCSFFEQFEDRDLIEEFSHYTISDLQSNLSKLIQVNLVYSYCESLIMEQDDCDLEVAIILDSCQEKNFDFVCDRLPFDLLIKLKKVKDELKQDNWQRQELINSILNLILENTLLYSTLTKFVCS